MALRSGEWKEEPPPQPPVEVAHMAACEGQSEEGRVRAAMQAQYTRRPKLVHLRCDYELALAVVRSAALLLMRIKRGPLHPSYNKRTGTGDADDDDDDGGDDDCDNDMSGGDDECLRGDGGRPRPP